ncbi:ABC transporter substrate-binding protein [Nocardia sp. NPDC058658]|uniref:ABC transporter substrate-binding protein n=1 Tax=Nocardia sp. NPDC058658 TaxID=3346580 RepID=UPI0036592391
MPRSRRDLLRAAIWAATAAGATGLTGGCASPPGTGPVENGSDATPRRGGTFRAALTGGGATESLDPFTGGSPADIIRNDVIFDSLFRLQNGTPAPALATAAELTADRQSFTLTLRRETTFHDGSELTADDVAYSLRYMSSPERSHPTELSLYLDLAQPSVVDRYTLRVPLRRPIGDPAMLLAAFPGKVIKNGTVTFTPETAVGTGPYRVEAFAPGRQTRLRRFDSHWDGAPFADTLELTSLSDAQAKVNAISTGQVDYAIDIPFTAARIGTTDPDLEIRTAGRHNRTSYAFVLNTGRAPFDDPRVRRAIRLAIDRQAMVDTVMLGYGSPGNDLFGSGAQYFSAREPLARNLDTARALLRDAGAEDTEIRIRSTEYEVGFNASTQLLAEQLGGIGLTVKQDIVGVAEFFQLDALAAANGVVFAIGPIPLPVTYGRLAAYPSLAPADLDEALDTALAATDDLARAHAWEHLQDIVFDRGNTVVWGCADTLSIARKNVAGVRNLGSAKYPYLGKAGLA